MAAAKSSSAPKGGKGGKKAARASDSKPSASDAEQEKTKTSGSGKSGQEKAAGGFSRSAMQNQRAPETDRESGSSGDIGSVRARPRHRSGFLPLALGGAVAAAIGFGVAWYGNPRGYTPETAERFLEQDRHLEALQEKIDTLEAGVTSRFEAVAGNLSGLEARVTLLDEGIAALRQEMQQQLEKASTDLDDIRSRANKLEARILELEKRPIADAEGAVAAAVAAYEKELATLRNALSEQQTRFDRLNAEISQKVADALKTADALQKKTERSGKLARAVAALGRVGSAMEGGERFDEALKIIAEAIDTPLPEPLVAAARTGVTPIAVLQAEFPEAARAALAAHLRTSSGNSTFEKLGAFLKSQVKPRSLEPREGNDPDAVLSRAEAALQAGRLEEALAILKVLPEQARSAMEGWFSKAQTRARALKALHEVEQTLLRMQEG